MQSECVQPICKVRICLSLLHHPLQKYFIIFSTFSVFHIWCIICFGHLRGPSFLLFEAQQINNACMSIEAVSQKIMVHFFNFLYTFHIMQNLFGASKLITSIEFLMPKSQYCVQVDLSNVPWFLELRRPPKPGYSHLCD